MYRMGTELRDCPGRLQLTNKCTMPSSFDNVLVTSGKQNSGIPRAQTARGYSVDMATFGSWRGSSWLFVASHYLIWGYRALTLVWQA